MKVFPLLLFLMSSTIIKGQIIPGFLYDSTIVNILNKYSKGLVTDLPPKDSFLREKVISVDSDNMILAANWRNFAKKLAQNEGQWNHNKYSYIPLIERVLLQEGAALPDYEHAFKILGSDLQIDMSLAKIKTVNEWIFTRALLKKLTSNLAENDELRFKYLYLLESSFPSLQDQFLQLDDDTSFNERTIQSEGMDHPINDTALVIHGVDTLPQIIKTLKGGGKPIQADDRMASQAPSTQNITANNKQNKRTYTSKNEKIARYLRLGISEYISFCTAGKTPKKISELPVMSREQYVVRRIDSSNKFFLPEIELGTQEVYYVKQFNQFQVFNWNELAINVGIALRMNIRIDSQKITLPFRDLLDIVNAVEQKTLVAYYTISTFGLPGFFWLPEGLFDFKGFLLALKVVNDISKTANESNKPIAAKILKVK